MRFTLFRVSQCDATSFGVTQGPVVDRNATSPLRIFRRFGFRQRL